MLQACGLTGRSGRLSRQLRTVQARYALEQHVHEVWEAGAPLRGQAALHLGVVEGEVSDVDPSIGKIWRQLPAQSSTLKAHAVEVGPQTSPGAGEVACRQACFVAAGQQQTMYLCRQVACVNP